MQPIEPQIRPAAKIPGGKYYMAMRLVRMMPAHQTYISASAGMFSDLLNKPRSETEILNDIDPFTVNLINCLRDRGREFIETVRALPYSVEVFLTAAKRHHERDIDGYNPEPETLGLIAAIDLYVYRRMSRGGRGTRNPWADHARKSFAWSERLRGGRPGDENAWITGNEQNLPRVIERLQGVQTRCGNADNVYREFGGDENVLIYDDPPYFHGTRSAARLYGTREMSDEAHARRLTLVRDAQCMVMLSGYDNNLYRAVVGNGRTIIPDSGRKNLFGFEPWRCRRFDLPNNQSESDKKQRRVECVWTNFEPAIAEEIDDMDDIPSKGERSKSRQALARKLAERETQINAGVAEFEALPTPTRGRPKTPAFRNA